MEQIRISAGTRVMLKSVRKPVPDTDWLNSLAHVERAIQNCLGSLELYERKFERLLNESGTSTTLTGIEARLAESQDVWTQRLQAAEDTSQQVEELFAEHEQLWSNWLDSYNDWKQSISKMSKAA